MMDEQEELTRRLNREFYVYYNDERVMMGVSGKPQSGMNKYAYALFKYEEVKDFLIGAKNTSSYLVIPDSKDPTKSKIEERVVEINHMRRLDRFLTEIDPIKYDDAYLAIKCDLSAKKVTFTMLESKRQQLIKGDYRGAMDVVVKGVNNLNFYWCLKNDPSFVLETISVEVQSLLLGGTLEFDIDSEFDETSLFSRKIFPKYSYEVING